MRVPGSWSLLLAASCMSSLALAQPAPPDPPPAPEPAPAPAPPPTDDTAPAASTTESPSETTEAAPPISAPSTGIAARAEVRAGTATPVGVPPPAPKPQPRNDFARNFRALPLTLEARIGFNARLGSSFDDATEEEHWGPSYAFATYLAWKPEFALGLELDYNGLGRVHAMSGQTSIDNDYSATGGWLAARVFPIRRERLDLFVNLRVGMVWQHVAARGTRESASITEPAQSVACTAWDGPGLGLGGGLGLVYRFGRHVAFVSRVDLNGQRLSSGVLDGCADGIGSVASLSGSVGLAFEFETAPK